MTKQYKHLQGMACAASNEDEDALLWALAEIERLRSLIPPHIVREFMARRHFWAAHEIDIVARKDAKEYRLEGDWLKDACRALEPKP